MLESNGLIRDNSFEWNIREHNEEQSNDSGHGRCVTYSADAEPILWPRRYRKSATQSTSRRQHPWTQKFFLKRKAFMFSVLPISGIALLCLEVPRLRPLALLIRTVWYWQGKTELLEEKLPQRHYIHHKFHVYRPGIETGSTAREAGE
jgi:hypothetical protein